MAVRVDRTIGELLARVDALVGLDHTIVALTADHGVAPVPEVQQKRKLPGGRLKQEELFGPITAALTAKYGEGKWILATAGTSPYFNHPLIAEKGLDPAEVRRVAAVAAAAIPHVARVYTREQLLSGEVRPTRSARRIVRGYNLQRSGDLEIVLDAYWLRATAGTTHGTPYSYDAHIPLVLMGPGITAGQLSRHRRAQRPGADPGDARQRGESEWLVGSRAGRSADAGRARAAARHAVGGRTSVRATPELKFRPTYGPAI